MKRLQWLAVTAGIAALAACGDNDADDNAMNADANMAIDNTMLPPADNLTIDANNVTVVDNNMATDTNMANDTNTTNAY